MTPASPVLRRLLWYKNRLAAMSGSEVFWRVREAARRRFDRAFAARLALAPRDCGPLPDLPGLRAGLAAWDVPQETLTTWREEARRARNGSFFLLNREWPPCPPERVWHLDPITQTLWPRDAFCFAIDYRHAGDGADIKYAWELNRLQWLQPVAALAFKTGDADLARFCLDRVESWIDENPPFRGVNWNSGIELALRAVSLLVVGSLLNEHLARGLRGKIWSSLRLHARWLERYPSRYSSANNHRAAESLGLFLIGALCPHFSEAARWQKKGWAGLCDSARVLILPDGGGAEQSTAYAAFALEMILLGLHVARARGIEAPDFLPRRAAALGEYLRWLTDAGGAQPMIGDDDNSCVLGAYRPGDGYISSLIGCVAALTGRADLTPPGLQPHLRQAVFGFAPAPDFAPGGWRMFAHAGLSVGRHKRKDGDVLLAFDHGPVGFLSIAAHGHADTLGLWLHLGDQPIFVDSGTYSYHADEGVRARFRGTRAHNCLTLGGEDSSRMAGNFNWARKAEAHVGHSENRGTFWQVEAQHDGYADTHQTLVHRALRVSPESGFVIHDWLDAPAAQEVEIGFLLHPALTARQEGGEILVAKGEKTLLRLRHDGPLALRIEPQGGLYSPAFGVKQTMTRLVLSGPLEPGCKATTKIFWAD